MLIHLMIMLKNLSSKTTYIGINSAEIKNHEQNKNMLEVTVEFVSEIISHIKDKFSCNRNN